MFPPSPKHFSRQDRTRNRPSVSTKNNNDALARDYMSLLDEGRKEQDYQSYIEAHTQLVPREFTLNHGIWGQVVLRKLAFGSRYKCDFAFVTKCSLSWRCVFVEIERPDMAFFSGSRNDFHPDLNHAIQQIGRWRAWFRDNQHVRACEVFGPLLTFPQLIDPVEIRFVLVYGRRSELQASKLRRSLIESQQREDLRIISFDSLAEDLSSKAPLCLAAMHNEYIDLIADELVCIDPFERIPPESLRASRSLLGAAMDEADSAANGEVLSPLMRKHRRRLVQRIGRVHPSSRKSSALRSAANR